MRIVHAQQPSQRSPIPSNRILYKPILISFLTTHSHSSLTLLPLSTNIRSRYALVANLHTCTVPYSTISATSRSPVFPNMFSTLILSLALAASTVHGHSDSLSAAAIVTGTPFDMRPSTTPTPTPTPTPSPELAARQNDWVSPPAIPIATPPFWSAPPIPSAPAWSQPAIPTPTVPTAVVTVTAVASPSSTYSWDETHDDSKNTRQHRDIAIGIVGGLVVLVLLVFIPCMLWHRCYKGGRCVKNKGAKVPDVEEGRAHFNWVGNAGCAGLPQAPQPLVQATRGKDGIWSHIPL